MERVHEEPKLYDQEVSGGWETAEGSESERPGMQKSSIIYMLRVEDSFSIYGDGCIVTGILKGGRMSVGDQVWILHADGSRKLARVKKMVVFEDGEARKAVRAEPDTRVGFWTKDASAKEVPVGSVISSKDAV